MIDTSGWKEFRVGNLFPFIKVDKYAKKPTSEGQIEFITSSSYNNGVSCYCGEKSINGNCITVSTNGKCFDCFYHHNNIVISTDVEVLYSDKLNELNGLFICSILQQEQKKYGFVDKPKNGKVFDTVIKLPATSDGQPDWDYMESYMKVVMEESEKALSNLKKADDTKHLIDISSWKEFHLYDIFDIDMGSKMDRGKMSNGDIAFVGRTANNNGINARIGCVVNHEKYGTVEPYDKGCITLALGGSIGSCFLQEEPFYTSQNVAVLMPKNNKSEYALRYITSVITYSVLHGKYEAFTEELNKHIKTDFTIILPATSDGQPNWQYMEDYMRRIMDKSEQIINNLQIGA